jgi:uncharacterized protein (TIGR02246 family)
MLALLSASCALPAAAKEECARIDAAGAAAWFDQWNLALASLNPDKVAQRYWQDAVLLPTLSNTPRTTPTMVREYFEHFLQQHPRGRIDTRNLRLGCNLVVDMGTYTFALMDDEGHTSDVAGRYTFVYEYRGGAWKILHHHSSAMPDSGSSAGGAETKQPKRPTKGSVGGRSAPAGGPSSAGVTRPSVVGGSQPFLNADNSPNVAQFYPAEARARGEQGAVSLQICTSPSGELKHVAEVLESSGSEQLDAAAQEWANAANWIPATRQNTAVEGCTRVRVEFGVGQNG